MNSEDDSSRKTTVLVVDDDPVCLYVVSRALEDQGFDVICAKGGEEALEICSDESRAIDAVLTDIFMPDLGGMELAERLKKSRPKTAFIFMTGYLNKVVNLHWRHGHQLISKPVDPTNLRDMIDVQINVVM